MRLSSSMVMIASDAVSASVRNRCSLSRSDLIRSYRDRANNAAAAATAVVSDARNHHRRQTGGRIVKEAVAGDGLLIPSVVTARTAKVYEPGERFAKSTVRCGPGMLHSPPAPSSRYS